MNRYKHTHTWRDTHTYGHGDAPTNTRYTSRVPDRCIDACRHTNGQTYTGTHAQIDLNRQRDTHRHRHRNIQTETHNTHRDTRT